MSEKENNDPTAIIKMIAEMKKPSPTITELTMSGAIDARRRGLGRGLSALLGDDAEAETPVSAPATGNQKIGIEFLTPSPLQPRRRFEPEALASLAKSVREKGVMQPLLVRPLAARPGHYEIIAGERRWRAAQAAQLHEVPVIVKSLTDREALELALIENIQRSDLTAVEEAIGFRRLMAEFGHTQEELSGVIGKSRSHIANILRLLNLPESVLSLLEEGQISAGHARALVVAKDPLSIAKVIIAEDLSVRATEQLVQKEKRGEGAGAAGEETDAGEGLVSRTLVPRAGTGAGSRLGRIGGDDDRVMDQDRRALEESLSNSLGLKVTIAIKGKGGSLSIDYDNLDQLDSIISKLSSN
ncbi:MAG: ParB/RepB/Spo0J family partition protein [Candidatus Pacebacteria bacterium]|nr:ParB/RepB/Spo0J family partition protein [Candidatus Paceibacterota bacterium]